jgi:hypothetical protein
VNDAIDVNDAGGESVRPQILKSVSRIAKRVPTHFIKIVVINFLRTGSTIQQMKQERRVGTFPTSFDVSALDLPPTVCRYTTHTTFFVASRLIVASDITKPTYMTSQTSVIIQMHRAFRRIFRSLLARIFWMDSRGCDPLQTISGNIPEGVREEDGGQVRREARG